MRKTKGSLVGGQGLFYHPNIFNYMCAVILSGFILERFKFDSKDKSLAESFHKPL